LLAKARAKMASQGVLPQTSTPLLPASTRCRDDHRGNDQIIPPAYSRRCHFRGAEERGSAPLLIY